MEPVILVCTTSDRLGDGLQNIVVVADEPYLRGLLELRKIWQAVPSSLTRPLYAIEFWDESPSWGALPEFNITIPFTCENDWYRHTGEAQPLIDSQQEVSSVCHTLKVFETGVIWTAMYKHDSEVDEEIETPILHWEVIEQLLAGQEPLPRTNALSGDAEPCNESESTP